MSPVLRRTFAYICVVLLLVGLTGIGYVLYMVDDATTRTRVGFAFLSMIGLSLLIGVQVSSIPDPPSHPNRRRFHQLRRKVEEFLREVSRLNWLKQDVERDPRTLPTHQEGMDQAVARMRELIDEIYEAAGKVDVNAAESDAPFEPRFMRPFPKIPGGEPTPAPEADAPAEGAETQADSGSATFELVTASDDESGDADRS